MHGSRRQKWQRLCGNDLHDHADVNNTTIVADASVFACEEAGGGNISLRFHTDTEKKGSLLMDGWGKGDFGAPNL